MRRRDRDFLVAFYSRRRFGVRLKSVLMGVSAAVLTLSSLVNDHYDRLEDFFREPVGDKERFEFDEY